MTFNFTGVSVTWFGVYPEELPRAPSLASYSIDDSADSAFALKGLAPKSHTLYNQLLFKTEPLPLGTHTVTVKYLSDHKSTPLALDYLIVDTGTSITRTPTTTASPTLPSASIAAVSGSSKKHINVIGAVLGTLAGVLVLLVLIFVYYRHRRRKLLSTPQPFTLPSPYPRFEPRDPGTPMSTSTTSLRAHESSYLPHTDVFASSPVQMASRFRVDPQPSGSNPHAQSQTQEVDRDADESDSYYGGYQTWRDAKAQEAAMQSSRRDSYM